MILAFSDVFECGEQNHISPKQAVRLGAVLMPKGLPLTEETIRGGLDLKAYKHHLVEADIDNGVLVIRRFLPDSYS